jgi:gas vesicle protein
MTNGIQITDLLLLGGIIGGVIGAINALVSLGDRLWKRDRTDAAGQPGVCGAQHMALKESLSEQVAAVRDLATAMQAMQSTMAEALKADELRFQLMLKELQLINRGQDALVRSMERRDS